MSEEKKEVDVRDLKPTKDAKGGHRARRQSGGHQGADRVDSALGGKRNQP